MPERLRDRQPEESRGARVFIAIDLPKEVKELIAAELASVRRLARDQDLNLRWIRKDALHLTLAFVASADPRGLEEIVSVMTGISGSTSQFDLGLGGGGAFPGLREPSILWLGVTRGAEPLTALAQATQTAVTSIGYPQTPRPYRPHLTVARSRRIQDVGAIVDAASTISSPPFSVTEAVIIRSHLGAGPPRYERLARFPLGPAQ